MSSHSVITRRTSKRTQDRRNGRLPIEAHVRSWACITGNSGRHERLAYSPEEAADLLSISRELVHDLLRTGQLRSVKAGHRRLIGKHHLQAFLGCE
jgi:excisionase family DNA binding protein